MAKVLPTRQRARQSRPEESCQLAQPGERCMLLDYWERLLTPAASTLTC
jgi:hypothetical protein